MEKSRFTLDNGAELGSGGYGKVVTAKDNSTGEKVAAKIISTSRQRMTAIQKEVELMERLRHPGIVGLRGHEQHGKNYIIYMELAAGGELFSRVISAGALKESEARPYFKQLLLAVQYMHQHGVVHRDLKLENVLLADDRCKVCDFGLAHVHEAEPDKPGQFKKASLKEVCGSKSYCAPEVLDGRGYDGFPTDIWSCGICLFAMLAGFFPLDEASGSDWRFERVRMAASAGASVTHTIFGFYERPCELSKEVTDLIDGMLTLAPARRLTIDQALATPWVNGVRLGDHNMAPTTTYRGLGQDFNDANALRALLAQESDEPMPPVYRGLPSQGPPPGPPPMLCKQQPMFCADFHLAENE